MSNILTGNLPKNDKCIKKKSENVKKYEKK